MLEALAWSGWVWAACIYLALRVTRRERDWWRERACRPSTEERMALDRVSGVGLGVRKEKK